MLLLFFLTAIFCIIRKANAMDPICSPVYGTSINPEDCTEALHGLLFSTLWTRMVQGKVELRDNHSVYDLDWFPTFDVPAPETANTTSSTSSSAADSRLFAENQIAHDSGLVAPYRLSRQLTLDDVHRVFVLPLVRVHRSCAIGIDMVNTRLIYTWKSSERPLDAFRAIDSVLKTCTEGGRAHGQGGRSRTPHEQLSVFVTDPELLQNLPLHMSQSLEEMVFFRANSRIAWLQEGI